MALDRSTSRALRAVALEVVRADHARLDALAAAHRGGATIPEIAAGVGMDAFDVRDALVRAGVLAELKPKEAVANAGRRP